VCVYFFYAAFCKNPASGVWYSFNDSRATSITAEQEVVTRAAYLLFYEKRSSRLDSLSDPHSWLNRVQQSSPTAAATAAACAPVPSPAAGDENNPTESTVMGGTDSFQTERECFHNSD